MLLLDLALISQIVIVLIKLLKGVILTVMCIHLLHNLWISCPHINQLVPHNFLMLARLFYHSQNVLLIDFTHFLEEFECVVATHHIVLEDIIDQAHLFKDPMTEERSYTAHILPANAQLENQTIVDEAV